MKISEMNKGDDLSGAEMLEMAQSGKEDSVHVTPDMIHEFLNKKPQLLPWTPGVTATTSPLVFKTDGAASIGSGTVTFSNGNKTVNEDTNGAIAFADVPVNNPNKMGVYFNFSPVLDAASPNGSEATSYCGLVSADGDMLSNTPSFGVNPIILSNKDSSGAITYELNVFGYPFDGGAPELNIPLNITDTTEFCIAWDSVNGVAEFYSSEQPDVAIATYTPPAGHPELTRFLAYTYSSEPVGTSCTLIDAPAVEHAGVTLANNNTTTFDPASYPAERAGRLFEIKDLAEPLDIEGTDVTNGDAVWFDLVGNFQGRAFIDSLAEMGAGSMATKDAGQAANQYQSNAENAAMFQQQEAGKGLYPTSAVAYNQTEKDKLALLDRGEGHTFFIFAAGNNGKNLITAATKSGTFFDFSGSASQQFLNISTTSVGMIPGGTFYAYTHIYNIALNIDGYQQFVMPPYSLATIKAPLEGNDGSINQLDFITVEPYIKDVMTKPLERSDAHFGQNISGRLIYELSPNNLNGAIVINRTPTNNEARIRLATATNKLLSQAATARVELGDFGRFAFIDVINEAGIPVDIEATVVPNAQGHTTVSATAGAIARLFFTYDPINSQLKTYISGDTA